MVDAVAKWAAEGVLREPELLVRRSIATPIGVTDYGRVDGESGNQLSSLAIGGKVFSEVGKRLQMMWARNMIREKLGDDEHSGRIITCYSTWSGRGLLLWREWGTRVERGKVDEDQESYYTSEGGGGAGSTQW